MAAEASREAGLDDPRITSDVKHVEIGLTDKADSARFAASWLGELGITGRLVLIGGDEFGTVGGVPGSDSLMMVPSLARSVVVSVGVEPSSVPPGVVHLGGGPPRLLDLFDAQLDRRRRHRVPGVDADPAWVVPLPAADDGVAASLGALCNGWAGTRATPEEHAGSEAPSSSWAVSTAPPASCSPRRGGPRSTWPRSRASRRDRRLLDLRTGVLARGGALRSLRFVPATVAQRPGPAGRG